MTYMLFLCQDGEDGARHQVCGGGGWVCGKDLYADFLHHQLLPWGIRAHNVSAPRLGGMGWLCREGWVLGGGGIKVARRNRLLSLPSSAESQLSEFQLSEHYKSNSSTCKTGNLLDHTSSLVSYKAIFFVVQLPE